MGIIGVLCFKWQPKIEIALDGTNILNCLHLQSIDLKIVSEYDQEIPQSQTADNSMAPRGRATQPSRDTRKTN